jgi:hypothetical protein
LVSQLVTLYITPVFYIYLDHFSTRVFPHKNEDLRHHPIPELDAPQVTKP